LIKVYSAFKNADAEIHERVVTVELNWMRTEQQIEILGKLWDTLDVVHQEQHSQILEILATKIKAAIRQVERVHRKFPDKDGNPQVNRLKYAMIKGDIDTAIRGLETWQRNFDPSWYLMLRIANPVIDRELAREPDDKSEKNETLSTARNVRSSLEAGRGHHASVFLGSEELVSAHRRNIPFSTAEVMQRSAKSSKTYIVDSVPCLPEVRVQVLTEDVRDLARVLRAVDPKTFGLLQCRGVVKVLNEKNQTPGSFDFIFSVPSTLMKPRSLRHILLLPDTNISLTSRFRVAQQLAQSVSYVHTCKFVHKSIRPDTVLVFENEQSTLAASFLLGFEKFRTAARGTLRAGDCAWEKDLYRHPRRQGLKPEDEYTMQHDIYSLGVCLLEIGLWESLVLYEGEPSPSPLIAEATTGDKDEAKRAALLKQHLVYLAETKLPSRMGDAYTNVVINCLTCLDEENQDFGNQAEFEDDDGVLIGVRYIEKV